MFKKGDIVESKPGVLGNYFKLQVVDPAYNASLFTARCLETDRTNYPTNTFVVAPGTWTTDYFQFVESGILWKSELEKLDNALDKLEVILKEDER